MGVDLSVCAKHKSQILFHLFTYLLDSLQYFVCQSNLYSFNFYELYSGNCPVTVEFFCFKIVSQHSQI